jgi:hypothetical protein
MSKARQLADLGNVYDDGALSNRNLIINGAMQVAQRGTSFSLSGDAYTLDRWTTSSAGGVSLSVSQQTATSSDNAYFSSKNYLRYTRNNAVLSGLVYKVEDLQQFNNKTFTLSFWAKSSDLTNTMTPTIYTVNDGSSFNSYYSNITDVSDPALSSTWQKYVFNITFQDMYGYGFSGSHHLRLQFGDGSTVGTLDIAQVQLELGDTATPFEHRSYGDELARCQRYYQVAVNTTFREYIYNVHRHPIPLRVSMRSAPTLTVSHDGSGGPTGGVDTGYVTTDSLAVGVNTTATGNSPGANAMVDIANLDIFAEAEL